MRKSLVAGLIVLAMGMGFAAGWIGRGNVGGGDEVGPVRVARSNVVRSTNMGDEHEAWEKVPATSPEYATAQRLLGYNYSAHDKHDLVEAKRHVDIALSLRPEDPKVLEDAGRVYVMAGLREQGTAMLKKADTEVARDFLARR